MDRSAANARQYGRRLAELADKTLDDLSTIQVDRLALRWKTVTLPARSVAGAPAAVRLPARVGAFRLGEACFACLPGEPFVEIALAIRRASRWKFTAVIGYADDYIGYIPTDRAFANGGYETGPGRWSRVAAGSEAIIRKTAIELLSR
jgi:hypothetical protein